MTRPEDLPVLVVGSGIMGTGIAQVAAQSGHSVLLYDLREGAAAEAKRRLGASLERLVAKGKLPVDQAGATLARIEPVDSLAAAAEVRLVVEAIAEQIEDKRNLFRELESIIGADAVLATNTSSIGITAIANGLKNLGRIVGMHFFNPVPLMKLVEVVSGLQTKPVVAEAVFELARTWGKVPVHAKNTPGFIVNRIARPYYAETLALLQEQAAAPAVLDACLRAAGFRMGPCELMDLIGHDTNFAVTRSVFEANFFDKRYAPSLVQREMVDGGLFGRKSGQGFYAYPAQMPPRPAPEFETPSVAGEVTVYGDCIIADALVQAANTALARQGACAARERRSNWSGVQIDGARLVLTDGRPAFELAASTGIADIAVFDRPMVLSAQPGQNLAYALNSGASLAWQAQAPRWLRALGFAPLLLADAPGLVVARTVAMLINEAADAVLQGVCTAEGANEAMKLGLAFPAGPFEWLRDWSVEDVVAVVSALDAAYRGERYRVSPWLRRQEGRN